MQFAAGDRRGDRPLAFKRSVQVQLLTIEIHRHAFGDAQQGNPTPIDGIRRERRASCLDAEVLPRNRRPGGNVPHAEGAAHDHARELAGQDVRQDCPGTVAALPVGGGIEARAIARASPCRRHGDVVELCIDDISVCGERKLEAAVRHGKVRKRVRLAFGKREAARRERNLADAVVVGDVEGDLRARSERKRPAHVHGVERNGELKPLADLKCLRRKARIRRGLEGG